MTELLVGYLECSGVYCTCLFHSDNGFHVVCVCLFCSADDSRLYARFLLLMTSVLYAELAGESALLPVLVGADYHK